MSGELVVAARKRKTNYYYIVMSSIQMILEGQFFLGVHPQTLNSSNPSRLFTLQDKFTSSLKTSLWQKSRKAVIKMMFEY